MKIEKNAQSSCRGFTLIELTFTVLILMSLIGITFAASQAYVKNSQEASCLINQDKIIKTLTANSMMRGGGLKPGVNYCSEAEVKEIFDEEPLCPEGGKYSAVLGDDGKTLIVTCLEHGHSHE